MSSLPLERRAYAGQVVAGRYRVLYLLASGGMGSVWAAERIDLGGRVALKFAHQLDAEARARFASEAKIIAGLSGAHVVRVFDVGSHDGVPFFVMEYLEGETLKERLRAVGKLPAAATLDIISQIALGLTEAHDAGITHRDLKPANIFLTGAPSSPVVKILDFGIAHRKNTLPAGQGVWGTPCYMSPEQVTQPHAVGIQADLWSLAVICFECLVGRPAFTGATVSEVLQAITRDGRPSASTLGAAPQAYDAWFVRATAKRVEDRFGSARVLVRELKTVLGAERVEHLRSGDTIGLTTARRSARHKAWLARVPLATAALLVFGAVALWRLQPPWAFASRSAVEAEKGPKRVQDIVDEAAFSPVSTGHVDFAREAAVAPVLPHSSLTDSSAGRMTPAAESRPKLTLPNAQPSPTRSKVRSSPAPGAGDAVWTERL